MFDRCHQSSTHNYAHHDHLPIVLIAFHLFCARAAHNHKRIILIAKLRADFSERIFDNVAEESGCEVEVEQR